MKKIIAIAVLFLSVAVTQAQENLEIEKQLEELSKKQPGLNDIIISEVTGLNLYTFISSIALDHQLNVDVDPQLTTVVEGNYFNLSVKDVFLFLIKKHELQVSFINTFIIFKKKETVIEPPKKFQRKELEINYRQENNFLSVNLKKDSLSVVAEVITQKSGKNIIISPEVKGAEVSGYFQNRPFGEILGMIGRANGLVVIENEETDSYLIEKGDSTKEKDINAFNKGIKRKKSASKQGEKGYYDITILDKGYLTINAMESNISEIILEAAEKLHLNYYMYSIPTDISTTLVANQITFDDLLETVFRGQKYTFSKDNTGFYYIGKRDEEGLRHTELIQLENRTIETVMLSIPAEIKKDIEIKEFAELNGLVVSGSKPKVVELRHYLRIIDKVVPMVQLEVFIVQYNKSHDVQTGIQAGLKKDNPATTGILFPATDVQMNAESVNGLIDLFNGYGIFNLGKVTEQFYLNLKFLENNSILRLESTPKIATLSGHDATLKIGQTSYYFEQRNDLVPLGNNNSVAQSGTWKPTEANLSVKIKPYVSKDEQITLELSVEKSSFLGRVGQNAPPGKATQSFDSFIRVKNNEMVLLGGLDELNNENSGTGVPLISRIPILKWFFSGRSQKKQQSKLHLFVKPTVTY